jgi:DNA-directed RNA polymerase subunit P
MAEEEEVAPSEEPSEAAPERKIYMCLRCGTVFSKSDLEISPGIHCPNCGYRILIKIRTFKAKPVNAE